MALNLVAEFLEHNWRRVAFIGIAKHAGKTTAMNQAIRQAEEIGVPLGLCSIGLDGERLDTIMGIDKPPVFVPAGTVIASAENALLQSETQLEYLADTGIPSPLGNVLIAKAIWPGKVLLAGVRQRHHVARAVPYLHRFGAQLVFVDGAFDRVASAVPGLVDAAVLVIGAVSGKTVDQVVAVAYPFLQRFHLPLVEDGLRSVFQPALEAQEIAAWDGVELKRFPRHQGILGLRQDAQWSAETTHVFIPGAVSDAVLENLMGHPRPLQVIASHPAQVIAGNGVLERWFRKNHTLVLWQTLPLAAVAVNPYSIQGYSLSESELFEKLTPLVPGVPLYNAAAEEGSDSEQVFRG